MTSSEAWAWVADNRGLIHEAVKRFHGDRAFGDPADAFQESAIAVAVALRGYDPARGSLLGLVYAAVKNRISNHDAHVDSWRHGGRTSVVHRGMSTYVPHDGRGRQVADPGRGIELRDEAEHALRMFRGWHRDVLIRVYLNGEDPDAVAASIGYRDGRLMLQSLGEAIRARRVNPKVGTGIGRPQKKLVPA